MTARATRRGVALALALMLASTTGCKPDETPAAPELLVSPVTVEIGAGETVMLTATLGGEDVTDKASWVTSDKAVATLDTPGEPSVVRGVAAGTVLVFVTLPAASPGAERTRFATVAVRPAVLTKLAVSPIDAPLPSGTTARASASGHFSDGSIRDLSSEVVWRSSAPETVGVSAEGIVTALKTGTAQISAEKQGVPPAAMSVTVTDARIVGIDVEPGEKTVPAGRRQVFTARATYTDGTRAAVTQLVDWSSSAPAVASIDETGTATGKAIGVSSISARRDGIVSPAATLVVVSPVVDSVEVAPHDTSIPAGRTATFGATVTLTDGTRQDATSRAVWAVTEAAVATFSIPGVATGRVVGSTEITASVDGAVSPPSKLTVTAPVVVAVTVSPAAVSVTRGRATTFSAKAVYSDGSESSDATWVSSVLDGSNQVLATVSPGGVASTSSSTVEGVGLVTAVFNQPPGVVPATLTGTAQLTVTPKALQSITIAPSKTHLYRGRAVGFTVEPVYTDGTHTPVLDALADGLGWRSDAPAVAAIDSNGSASFAGVGTANISLTCRGVVSNQVALAAVAPSAISVEAASDSLAQGRSQQYNATASYDYEAPFGTPEHTLLVTRSASWKDCSAAPASPGAPGTCADTGMVSVDSSGLASVSNSGTGSAHVWATLDGVTGSRSLTATGKVLERLVLSSGRTDIYRGRTETLVLVPTYSNGDTAPLPDAVTWTGTDSSKVSVAGGVASFVALGSSRVTATANGVTSNELTLTARPPASITLSPGRATVARRLTSEPLVATAHYPGGHSASVSSLVTWMDCAPGSASCDLAGAANTNSPKASINSAGGATGLETGAPAAEIKAALDGVTSAAAVLDVAESPTRFWVAPHGDDSSGNGTETLPWKTIHKARDFIRGQGLNQNMTADIEVNIAAGDYFVDKPITFGVSDSGSNGHFVVYRSAHGTGSARIHGGLAAGTWEHIAAGSEVWRLRIPALAEGVVTGVDTSDPTRTKVQWSRQSSFPSLDAGQPVEIDGVQYAITVSTGVGLIYLQPGLTIAVGAPVRLIPAVRSIYENGKRARLARSPNHATRDRYPAFGGSYKRSVGGGVSGEQEFFEYASGDFTPETWTLNPSARVVWWTSSGSRNWGMLGRNLLSIDPASRKFFFMTSGGAGPAASGDRYYVEGVREVLDAPGEYFHDSREGWLYYQPRNSDPNAQDIRVAAPRELIKVQGSDIGTRAHHLKFVGLSLAYTRGSDGATAAVVLRSTDHVEIRDCHIHSVGDAAIWMDRDNAFNTVQGCWIHNAGVGGIWVTNSLQRAAYPNDRSEHHLISNCKIHDLGEELTSAIKTAGVLLYSTNDTEVSYCDISRTSRYAISLRGHWSTEQEPGKEDSGAHFSRDNRFSFIRIRDALTDSGDGGALHAAHCNGRDDPTGSANVNYWDQILISGVYADPSMDDWAPNGIFLDHPYSCVYQSLSNIKIAFTAGPPLRTNRNPDQTLQNVSWEGAFDETLIDHPGIGLRPDFPRAYDDRSVVVVDDHTIDYSESDGTWTDSQLAGLLSGDGRYHGHDPAGSTQYAEWRPTLPATGWYEVSIWRMGNWAAASGVAPYTVFYAGGSAAVTVDQASGTGGWVPVGTYPFLAGHAPSGGYVRLYTNTADGREVRADAVKFTLRPGP